MTNKIIHFIQNFNGSSDIQKKKKKSTVLIDLISKVNNNINNFVVLKFWQNQNLSVFQNSWKIIMLYANFLPSLCEHLASPPVVSVLLIFFVFCVVFPVSSDCQFFIAPSIFSNVFYLLFSYVKQHFSDPLTTRPAYVAFYSGCCV